MQYLFFVFGVIGNQYSGQLYLTSSRTCYGIHGLSYSERRVTNLDIDLTTKTIDYSLCVNDECNGQAYSSERHYKLS